MSFRLLLCESCFIKEHYDEDWSLRRCYALAWVNSSRYFEGSHYDFPEHREMINELHGVTSHRENLCEDLICRIVILWSVRSCGTPVRLTVVSLCWDGNWTRGAMYYYVALGRVRLNIVAVKKQWVLHILSVCLQPKLSSMQSACAVLHCHVACLTLLYFFQILS